MLDHQEAPRRLFNGLRNDKSISNRNLYFNLVQGHLALLKLGYRAMRVLLFFSKQESRKLILVIEKNTQQERVVVIVVDSCSCSCSC